MEKLVILMYRDGGVCSVFHVVGADENIQTLLQEAERAWNETREGLGADYDTFVLDYLRGRGIGVRPDENFEIYGTCL